MFEAHALVMLHGLEEFLNVRVIEFTKDEDRH